MLVVEVFGAIEKMRAEAQFEYGDNEHALVRELLDIRKNLMLERTQGRAEPRSVDKLRGLLGRAATLLQPGQQLHRRARAAQQGDRRRQCLCA